MNSVGVPISVSSTELVGSTWDSLESSLAELVGVTFMLGFLLDSGGSVYGDIVFLFGLLCWAWGGGVAVSD